MKRKIVLPKQFTLAELRQEIEKGCKFVAFQYCISLFFAISLRRFSPAIFVEDKETLKKYKKKYNLISYMFGWWGIPWGPIYTLKSAQLNNKGGIDVTDDIMLNITEESLQLNEVELKVTNQLFCQPDKWDKKAFSKAFLRNYAEDSNIKQLVVGLFINTEEDVAPFHTIGLKVDKDFEQYIEPMQKALYKQFRKGTYFEFVDLSKEDESLRLLEKQGSFIINKQKGQ